ncbi:hypothetical protein ACHAWF_001386 [Thalassiosira exigua]
MARFLPALSLLASAPAAAGFRPAPPSLPARASAPSAAAAPAPRLLLPLASSSGGDMFFVDDAPDYDAPIPSDPQSGTTVLDREPVVDDECYLGKDGTAEDCVDFDPPYNAARVSRSFNAMDSPRTAPAWAFGDDFDAPVLADPQSGTAVLTSAPVVDDECYLGKDGTAADCVDFDPPYNAARLSRSFNAMDSPRSAPAWTSAEEDDFDAPILADPQSGTTVLQSAPIVDDECYLGKDGTAADCVDFDPPAKVLGTSKVLRTRSANAQDPEREVPKWTQATQAIFANIVKEACTDLW